VAVLGVGAAASFGAVGNRYADGADAAVSSASPNLFRLNARTLEPGCYLADGLAGSHVDFGDDAKQAHLTVRPRQDFSIDEALVPGVHTGYNVINVFDTGTSSTDPDVDPDQTAVNLEAPAGDDVQRSGIIVCISDHEDSGQNEPYAAATDSGADDNEVYAKNRPIIQPTVAALGQSAVTGLKTYKMGLGYSVEHWYAPDTIADVPPFTLPLTDPMAFLVGSDGLPTHLNIPTRIAGPVYGSESDGPGVLRVNDIDTADEDFLDPHYEISNYDQVTTFSRNGDPKAFCLGGACAGLLTFGTQGDLPVKWSLKPSLTPDSSLRSVEFTDDDFRAWNAAWQAYYRGAGPKPTLPLAPGTNSPDPEPTVIVNLPETRPASGGAQVPVSTSTNSTTTVNVTNVCVSNRQVTLSFSKKAKAGQVRFNGKTIKATRIHGRLRATVDFRGIKASPGAFAKVIMRSKMHGKWSSQTRLFKLC
jgi:hypothetical protein